jgi:hypothetical protein
VSASGGLDSISAVDEGSDDNGVTDPGVGGGDATTPQARRASVVTLPLVATASKPTNGGPIQRAVADGAFIVEGGRIEIKLIGERR